VGEQCKERGRFLGQLRDQYSQMFNRVIFHTSGLERELAQHDKLAQALQKDLAQVQKELFDAHVESEEYHERFVRTQKEVSSLREQVTALEDEKQRSETFQKLVKDEWDNQKAALEATASALREELEDVRATATATKQALQDSKDPNMLLYSLLRDNDKPALCKSCGQAEADVEATRLALKRAEERLKEARAAKEAERRAQELEALEAQQAVQGSRLYNVHVFDDSPLQSSRSQAAEGRNVSAAEIEVNGFPSALSLGTALPGPGQRGGAALPGVEEEPLLFRPFPKKLTPDEAVALFPDLSFIAGESSLEREAKREEAAWRVEHGVVSAAASLAAGAVPAPVSLIEAPVGAGSASRGDGPRVDSALAQRGA